MWGYMMLIRCLIAVVALLGLAGPVGAQGLSVKLDADAARAVLAAVRNPALTREQALAIARLPGNQGLIRKVKSYNQPADEARLADALLTAAQGRTSETGGEYKFAEVRDNADKIAPVVEALADPASLSGVQARIALFTPARVAGRATGYLIVGGPSGGFAFGEPEFYLNIARYPVPSLARIIMGHELFHGVQGLALGLKPQGAAAAACLAKMPEAENLGRLFGSLRDEGMASYVGDVLALPVDDLAAKPERDRAQRRVNMVGSSITLLGLSTYALTSGSGIAYDDIYALGFYGDEILYSLGYVMVRAIAAEQGNAGVADLIDQPGAVLVARYLSLAGYGKSKAVPALDPVTVTWARRLAACG
ncbi:MAG: hypothetical protein EOP60_10735 [Sphingomonadales bacterium]|nr:MAG: hypothetical protein EOP60_10735 [Sphingomonadales bacterium]